MSLVSHMLGGVVLGALVGAALWFPERRSLLIGWLPSTAAGLVGGLAAGTVTGSVIPTHALSLLVLVNVAVACAATVVALGPRHPLPATAYSVWAPGDGAGRVDQHPLVTVSLVLGIIGLAPAFAFLSPFAWHTGGKALREIDAAPHRYSGRSQANAGRVLGIIGTVLLVVGIVTLLMLVLGFVAATNG